MGSSLITSNPYVGMRAYSEEDAYLFYGREREVEKLHALVVACPILLLYGPSGSGKTSLIQAGVIPRLQKQGREILPVVRVGQPTPLLRGEIDNVFVFNTLLSWNTRYGDPQNPSDLARLTLSQYIEQHRPQVDHLGEAISRVAIFDQIEELFTTHQTRWQERKAFFEQLATALQKDENLNAVLLIREEFLALLDQYAGYLPGKLRDRMRVEPLRREAAMEAVLRPASLAGRPFTREVAERLVEDLMRVRAMDEAGRVIEVPGEYVDLMQVQIVCSGLWARLPAEATTITAQDLMALGDLDTTLSRFYESVIQQATAKSGVAEEMLRHWFEGVLITPVGTRSIVFRGQTETGGLPNEAVDILAASRLLRTEVRSGAQWIELTHDRLIEPIRKSNHRFIADATGARKSRNIWQRSRKLLQLLKKGGIRGQQGKAYQTPR